MIKQIETELLDEAFDFLQKQKPDVRKKILHNLRRTELNINQKSFKKVTNEVWEYKVMYVGLRSKFFVFWNIDNNRKTLVIVKPVLDRKTKEEILKINRIRVAYQSRKNV